MTLACLLVLSACDDEPMSLGEVCSAIANPTCDRAVSCGIATAAERKDCVHGFIEGCCLDDGTCGAKAPSEAEEKAAKQLIAQCSAAWPTFDCQAFSQGQVPAACSGDMMDALTITPASRPPASRATATPVVRDRRLDQIRRVGRQSSALMLRR